VAYQLVNDVLDHAPGMTPAERLVLVAIAEETRSAGDVVKIPGSRMRRRAKLGERGLRDVLTRLAKRGIEVRVPLGADRRGQPIYAVPGEVPKYRLPAFPAPTGCDCRDDCRPPMYGPEPPYAQVADGGVTAPPSPRGLGKAEPQRRQAEPQRRQAEPQRRQAEPQRLPVRAVGGHRPPHGDVAAPAREAGWRALSSPFESNPVRDEQTKRGVDLVREVLAGTSTCQATDEQEEEASA